MPIQLRKEKMKPWHIKFRILGIVMLFMSVLFSILFGMYVEKIALGVKTPVIVVCVVFCLYFISCVVTSVLGIMTYVKEDNLPVLVQGILTCAPVIFCLINAKTALLMILVVFNKDDFAVKILGDQNYYQYISTQYSHWVCLLIGLVVSMVIGVLSIVTFMKNKK